MNRDRRQRDQLQQGKREKRHDWNREGSKLYSDLLRLPVARRPSKWPQQHQRERQRFPDLICPRMDRSERQRHEHRQEDNAGHQQRPAPAAFGHATRVGHWILRILRRMRIFARRARSNRAPDGDTRRDLDRRSPCRAYRTRDRLACSDCSSASSARNSDVSNLSR
jgi:hypothetical protein